MWRTTFWQKCYFPKYLKKLKKRNISSNCENLIMGQKIED
jgi:hypothetical protein